MAFLRVMQRQCLMKRLLLENAPAPVWPYAEGEVRGVTLKPLYSCVPEAIVQHPDPLFYDMLTLLDAIRSGRARKKQIAIQKISEILKAKK